MESGDLVGMLTFRRGHQPPEPTPAASRYQRTQGDGRRAADRDPETEVMEVRRLMLERHARYLPVLDGRTLAGVILLCGRARGARENRASRTGCKAYIRDWPEPEDTARTF
jgi:hypothetical protein